MIWRNTLQLSDAFWIVFDTSQFRDYYQDVHNLLALPDGATLRYNYREVLVSSDAINLLKQVKRPILFVYAQRATEYVRAAGKSEPKDAAAPFRYIATRIGTMLNVTKIGDRYHFDFAVGPYPRYDAVFDEIMSDLATHCSVPANEIYVACSDRRSDFESLVSNDSDDAWTRIVEALGYAPIQFSNDAFWRLKGPFTRKGKLHAPVVRTRRGGGVAQTTAVYRASEHTYHRLQIISQSGQGAIQAGNDFEVVATSSDANLVVQGGGVYPVRHYNHVELHYNLGDSPPFFYAAQAELKIDTQPNNNGWPSGPDLAIVYAVSRNKVAFTFGSMLAIAGFILYALAVNAKIFNRQPLNPLADILLALIGTLCFVGAWWILTGRLGYQKPL